MVKRILWISRHAPLIKQKEELEKIFGKCLIIQYGEKIRDVDHVLELIRQYDPNEIVCVLPLTIISQLLERKIHPIWAEMKLLHVCESEKCPEYRFTSDWIDPSSRRHFRFVKFKRIVKLELVFQEL